MKSELEAGRDTPAPASLGPGACAALAAGPPQRAPTTEVPARNALERPLPPTAGCRPPPPPPRAPGTSVAGTASREEEGGVDAELGAEAVQGGPGCGGDAGGCAGSDAGRGVRERAPLGPGCGVGGGRSA